MPLTLLGLDQLLESLYALLQHELEMEVHLVLLLLGQMGQLRIAMQPLLRGHGGLERSRLLLGIRSVLLLLSSERPRLRHTIELARRRPQVQVGPPHCREEAVQALDVSVELRRLGVPLPLCFAPPPPCCGCLGFRRGLVGRRSRRGGASLSLYDGAEHRCEVCPRWPSGAGVCRWRSGCERRCHVGVGGVGALQSP